MPIEEMSTVFEPSALPNFMETGYIRDIAERAESYIAAGFPIHFRGAAGTGKTTLALHVASKIGRPVIIMHGDEELTTSNLVGGQYGYRMRKLRDNYIHSVLKSEEDMRTTWVDNRLTVACKYGFTLIYDEFTRSRPEANNVLLSILQERMMDLPAARGKDGYLKVAPDFVAIFTSNPEEYAGVFRSPDALRDRMITMDIDFPDRETEVSIASAKSGLTEAEAGKIVDMIRELRGSGICEFAPTLRAGIQIARTLKTKDVPVDGRNRVFRMICTDVLASNANRVGSKTGADKIKKAVEELIEKHCRTGYMVTNLPASGRVGSKTGANKIKEEVEELIDVVTNPSARGSISERYACA